MPNYVVDEAPPQISAGKYTAKCIKIEEKVIDRDPDNVFTLVEFGFIIADGDFEGIPVQGSCSNKIYPGSTFHSWCSALARDTLSTGTNFNTDNYVNQLCDVEVSMKESNGRSFPKVSKVLPLDGSAFSEKPPF